jgi:flagellar protein FliS
MSSNPALSYKLAAVQGASPVGQIIALYDTILRDLGWALVALASGDIENRINKLNHALSVIGYLEYVLDFERGGEAATRFQTFYRVTRGLIVEANKKGTPEGIEKLIELYGQVRQAWYQVERRSTPDQAGAADIQDVRPAFDYAEVARSHWSV